MIYGGQLYLEIGALFKPNHRHPLALVFMDSEVGDASTMSSTITNMVLWMFVPAAVTNFLLKQYYYFKYAKNSPSIPKPNSSKHKNNYKICYTLVIGIYFLYSLGQSLYSLEESYYSKIGVNRGCSKSEFKKKSRQLMLIHHPDKFSGNTNTYHRLKKMSEALENPNLCNIYEKFGESGIDHVLQVSSKKNYANNGEIRKDYIFATIIEWTTFYIGSAAVLFLLSFTKKSDSGRYWRFVSLMALAAYESYLYFNDFTTLESIHSTTRFDLKYPLTLMSFLLSRFTIYQRIQILRQFFVYSGLAMSQLGPLWFPLKPNLFKDKKLLIQEIENIQKGPASEIFEESKYIFNTAFEPFEDNEEMKSLLKRKMGQVIVDLKVLETMTAEILGESKKAR